MGAMKEIEYASESRMASAKAAWRAGRPLAELLPIRFSSGAGVDEIDCHCARCEAPIPADCLRGTLGWPIPHVASLEIVGICGACRLITPFCYRFRDGGAEGFRMEWYDAKKGWVFVDASGQGLPIRAWLRRVRKFLKLS